MEKLICVITTKSDKKFETMIPTIAEVKLTTERRISGDGTIIVLFFLKVINQQCLARKGGS